MNIVFSEYEGLTGQYTDRSETFIVRECNEGLFLL